MTDTLKFQRFPSISWSTLTEHVGWTTWLCTHWTCGKHHYNSTLIHLNELLLALNFGWLIEKVPNVHKNFGDWNSWSIKNVADQRKLLESLINFLEREGKGCQKHCELWMRLSRVSGTDEIFPPPSQRCWVLSQVQMRHPEVFFSLSHLPTRCIDPCEHYGRSCLLSSKPKDLEQFSIHNRKSKHCVQNYIYIAAGNEPDGDLNKKNSGAGIYKGIKFFHNCIEMKNHEDKKKTSNFINLWGSYFPVSTTCLSLVVTWGS